MGSNNRTIRILFSLVDNISDSEVIQSTIRRIIADCQVKFGDDNIDGAQLYPNPDREWQDQRRAFLHTTPDRQYIVGAYLRGYNIEDEVIIKPKIEFGKWSY